MKNLKLETLTIQNSKQLLPWIHKAGYKEFNANIHTMLMWNDTYPISFVVQDHFAIVCFSCNHRLHWFAPYCEPQYRKEATQFLRDYSDANHIPLGIHSITQEYKDFLDSQYPNQVYFENHISGQDYVYDRQQQETLTGKKMQKRRNHYNAFIKEYGMHFSYFPLSKEHFNAIYEVLNKWQTNKEESDSIQEEEAGIHFLLDHFDELDILGGCIYIDGILQAFSISSYISEDMIQIHVEKADREIRGLYVAILKHFLETLPAEVALVNREDDMGLASLQKAKHDMRPIYRVKKYAAYFGEVQIMHPTQEDIYAMQDLWNTSFVDETQSTTQFFFDQVIHFERSYMMKNRDGIMAMAFLNEWKMMMNKQEKTIYFLEGVATQEDYKRCGMMQKLINHILQEHKNTSFSLQAYNWNLYKQFGFEVTHYCQKGYIDVTKYIHTMHSPSPYSDAETLLNIYQNFIKDKDGYRIRNLSYYTEFFIPYQVACENEILVINKDTTQGYVTYYTSEDTLYVEEIIYQNKETLDNIISHLCSIKNKVYLTIDIDAQVVGTFEKVPMLMMNNNYQNENAFINECL